MNQCDDFRLSSLPADLLVHIMSFLTPQSILTLRRVSKSLSEVTNQRVVWIDALRRVCLQHEVYLPSFPLTEMALEDLEHAATTTTRFTARLRREFAQDVKVVPFSKRRITSLDDTGEEWENMRFIPGGRFLITTSRCTLKLWDLGLHQKCPPKTQLNAYPIASLQVPGISAIHGVRTRASKFTPEVLVIVLGPWLAIDCHVHVFGLLPAATNPTFTPLAPVLVLPIHGIFSPSILGSSNQHLIVSNGTTVVLWDFLEDSWISWSRAATVDDTFYFCNNKVVIVQADQGQVQLITFPALYPRSVSSVARHIEPPEVLQEYPLRRVGGDSSLEPLSSCVSGLTLVFHGRETSTFDEPCHIDIFSDHPLGVLLTHFVLTPLSTAYPSPTQNQNQNQAHDLVPLAESMFPGTPFNSCHSIHLEWVNHRTVHSFVFDGRTLRVCISDVDGESSLNSKAKGTPVRYTSIFGELVTPDMRSHEMNIDICLMSSRACVRVPSAGSKGGFELMVLDYTKPKPDYSAECGQIG
ncbi:hypothetical protein C8J57DRAFT_683703 [Mycena rebaudengoi]|nr:hypothetical protein C8J57DRAFT_683703 [Mycena rebaudengoi]